MSVDGELLTNAAPGLGALFFDRVATAPDREAFRHPVDAQWVSVTWAETGTRVEALAAGLIALGIEPEQRVGIASGTRFEWILADLAIVCAGAATTTVYANTNAEDTAYILGDAQCQVVFAENAAQLDKLTQHRATLPDVTHVVLFDGTADGDWVMTLDDLAEMGAKYLMDHPRCVREAVEATTPEQLASIIYTSGTTGRPKGVRLSHRSWVYEGAAVAALDILHPDDVQLLWLPLAHSFGKVLLATQLACGFVSAVDGRLDLIVDNCAAVRPTFMAGVPRIFEKAHARISTAAVSDGRLKRAMFSRAFAVIRRIRHQRDAGARVPVLLRLQRLLFDRLVFTKVRRVFGGRIRFFVCGSAPLNQEIGEWFADCGLMILEGYGLTETAGGASINTPEQCRFGTVGLPLRGTRIRIGADGEVQLTGPNVMDEYHAMPGATSEAFTDDGWLRTGDVGRFDGDGFLTITGRIKDMFKTSGGKYVVPAAIEAKFMASCPYANHILVYGEAHNYCVALISLDLETIGEWAVTQGIDCPSAELVTSPRVRDLITAHVDRLNAELNRWETIKRFAILDHDLSIEAGELTPSLKVKRSVVFERYRGVLASLYP
jgi:long-chain acyl-CoA synthetase